MRAFHRRQAKSWKAWNSKWAKFFSPGCVPLLTACAFVFSSCGSWVGSPKKTGQIQQPSEPTTELQGKVELSFAGTNDTLSLSESGIQVVNKIGQNSGTLILSEAKIVLGQIQLQSSTGGDNSKIHFSGPFVVNLLTNEITPRPEQASLSAGSYNDLVVSLVKLQKDKNLLIPAGDSLEDKSIFLKGIYSDLAGNQSPFELSFDLTESFHLATLSSTETLVDIESETANSLIVAFQIGQWFDFFHSKEGKKSLDFSDLQNESLILNGQGHLQNKLMKIIKENIKNSSQFGRDEDGDGRLSEKDKKAAAANHAGRQAAVNRNLEKGSKKSSK